MTTRIRVDAGVCGFCTEAKASSDDSQHVALCIESDCEKIQRLAMRIQETGALDAYSEISPGEESVLLGLARDTLQGCCAGCVVPVGLFKAIQVAAGLALPKDLSIEIEKG